MSIEIDNLPVEPHLELQPISMPYTDQDEISILDLLILLAQHKALIFKITLSFAIISTIVSFLLPTRYTATVIMLPPQQSSSMGLDLTSQLGSVSRMAGLASGGGSSLLKNPNDMYVSMFKSETVEDAMIHHFGLMNEYRKHLLTDARKTFERYSDVSAADKDGLIRVSVEDRDPRRAAELANGYVDQFHELSAHLAITEAAQRRMFFQQQLERAKDQLSDAEVAFASTQQKTGLIQIDAQAKALIESAASLRAQIAAKEVQVQGMQTYATGENAELVQAREELNSLRAQLARLGGKEDVPGSILPVKGQMTAEGVEYVHRLRDVKYYETVFDILARQFEVAKLDEAKEGALIQVVDPALPPERRSSPKRVIIVAVSTAVGLIFGLIAAIVYGGLEKVRQDEENNRKLKLLGRMIGLRQS